MTRRGTRHSPCPHCALRPHVPVPAIGDSPLGACVGGIGDRYAWLGEHSAWIGGRRDSVGEELGESLAHRPSASGLVTENRGGNASLEMVDGDEADTGVETVK